MAAGHSPLTAAKVIATGGWHPGYARVIALSSDDGYGFALVDGNGDGAELEAEAWILRDGAWHGSTTSGAGPLDGVGPIRTGGQIDGTAWFAYGSAPGRDTVTIAFDGSLPWYRSGNTACGRSSPPVPAEAPGRPRSGELTRAPVMRGCASTRPGCLFRAYGGSARVRDYG